MRILEAATVRIGSNNMLHILLALDASDVGLDDPRNQCIVMDFYADPIHNTFSTYVKLTLVI